MEFEVECRAKEPHRQLNITSPQILQYNSTVARDASEPLAASQSVGAVCALPMMPLSGVLSSCDTLDIKASFCSMAHFSSKMSVCL
jgi:hypothetical protein